LATPKTFPSSPNTQNQTPKAAFPTRLGLALNVKDNATADDYVAAMRQQIRLGLDGFNISLKWDEYESQNGKPLADGVNAANFMGQDVLVTLGTIDTVKRRLPADVADKAWMDPDLLARWDGFLAKICGEFGKGVKWVSLGNEANVYLAQHDDEVDPYVRFLAHGRDFIHKTRPDIQVGVTVTCMDALTNPELASKLQEDMDVSIFTYYPVEGSAAFDMAQVATHFDAMNRLAGKRPFLLQEIGYPASPLLNSSEARQAAFVHSVFQQLDRLSTRIPLADYFMQVDFSPTLLKALEPYYGISDKTFLAFLGTLGLFDSTGKSRAAWAVFEEEALKRKPISG
jgi:hypothetical protein